MDSKERETGAFSRRDFMNAGVAAAGGMAALGMGSAAAQSSSGAVKTKVGDVEVSTGQAGSQA